MLSRRLRKFTIELEDRIDDLVSRYDITRDDLKQLISFYENYTVIDLIRNAVETEEEFRKRLEDILVAEHAL